MRSVLVTGICGFIGSHLAEAYAERGYEVYGVDTLETGRADNCEWYEHLDIVKRKGFYDFANKVRPELVVHCAASYKNPDKWHRDTDVNVAGAINVAAVAKHHNARIVYFQTVLPPISSYAISKIAGEQYLRLSGQPLTVFRLASVYGPRNLSGPIPTFYRRIKAGEQCTVVKDVTRDFVYIDDLVTRVLATEAEGVVEVRSGIETPIADLPALVGEAMGYKPRVRTVPRPVDDVQQYEMTGAPQGGILVSEGIVHAVEWYEENGVGETYTHLALKG